jgi:hypothetical protein
VTQGCLRRGAMIAAAVSVTLSWPSGAPAQATSSIRVVRRADRRGLIIRVSTTLADPRAPVDLRRFLLIDRMDNSVLPLRPISDTSHAGCPRATELAEDRICIALADSAAPLVDSHAYVLLMDSVAVAGGKPGKPRYLAGGTALPIEVVGAQVQPPAGSPIRMIEITYDIESSADTTLGLALEIGHRPILISPKSNKHPGRPLCYTLGSLSFKCFIDAPVHRGDSITATFVGTGNRATPLPPVTIKPAVDTTSDAVGLATKDTSQYSISLQGGLSQTTTARTATVQALWRNMPVALMTSTGSGSGAAYEGSLSPYLNLLWTTDTATQGYIEPGVQYSGYVTMGGNAVIQQVAAFLTPRAEADKNVTVVNFIPLDFEVKPGIRGLFAGALPFDGSYRVWPHTGVELGWTVKGTTVVRPESNDQARWKGGVGLYGHWPAPQNPSSFCRFIGCGGFDFTADWQHYQLLDVPSTVLARNHDYGTVSATYKFTAHTGLSLSWCNGQAPPLFSYQRVVSLGIAVVY